MVNLFSESQKHIFETSTTIHSMKLIIEVQDGKAGVFTAFLKSLNYVKTKTISTEKAEIIEGLKGAVDELNKIKKGNKKGIAAKELYDDM